jgi:preprotein translocase subunit YajC
MVLVFWLLILRPQRKQEKERQARVDALRKGDKVRTKGGVIAPVARIKDDEVVLSLAGDGRAEMVVHKAYIEEVYASGGKDGAAEGK